MRPLLSVAIATAGTMVALGPGAPDPGAELAARALVAERARAADETLASLEAALAPALDAARGGAARIVAGDELPGSHLRDAAARLLAADADGEAARAAVVRLDRARRAHDPAAAPLSAPLAAGELGSIGAQLDTAAASADAFAAMRRRAVEVTVALDRAFAAIEVGDLDRAEELVPEARAGHDAVAAWEPRPATLPVWIRTSDAMIGAVEDLVGAARTGDRVAAREAANAFAALADEAGTADRALRIALSEGGAAVAAAPLDRLAAGLASVRATRSAVASILQAAAR